MTAMAGNYKVLFLNSHQIKIDGRSAKVGDVFDDHSIIKWTEERQAMKVLNIDTNKRYLMVARLNEGKELTAYDILTQKKRLSTHDGNLLTEDKIAKLEMDIAEDYYLLDRIELATELEVDDTHYFLGSYRYGDTKLTKILKHEGGCIVIDESLFHVNGKELKPCDIILSINYIDGIPETPIFIKDNIEINIIPIKMD